MFTNQKNYAHDQNDDGENRMLDIFSFNQLFSKWPVLLFAICDFFGDFASFVRAFCVCYPHIQS